jgi:TonB family protein
VNITQKEVHPFSFFSKIVVSEKTLLHPDLEIIVSHENIHVREKHTLDILFTEIMFLLQWFNPFAWLLKDAVKNNLEYLTDHEIAKHYNPQTYQLAMVTLADKQGIAPFLTALNGSQLKNRIVMMKKKTENKFAILKQLAVLPLLAILVMGLSNKEVKTEVLKSESESKFETPSEQTDINFMSPVDTVSKPKEIMVVGYGTQKTESKAEGGYSISGGMNGKMQKGSENVTITPSSQNGLTIKATGDQTGQPLYVVDGVVTKNIEQILPENIERIDVLKDQSATSIYGDKGKNGVIIINSKTKYNSESGEIISQYKATNKQGDSVFYKVDKLPEFPGGEMALRNFLASEIKYPEIARENGIHGKAYVTFIVTKKGKVTDAKIARGIDPELDEEALRVINKLPDWKPGIHQGKPVNVSYTVTVYFELEDVVQQTRKSNPLIFIDGEETTHKVEDINEIDPATIESVIVLKGEKANKKYGEKGKNGVIEITLKNDEQKNETYLVLRKSIAQNIKYPVVAQENNQQGVVEVWASVAKDGTISNITDKKPDGKFINVDEVVVTALKSEKTVTSEKSKDLALLVKESKRVIEKLSPLTIPELAGETVCFRIRFVLQ